MVTTNKAKRDNLVSDEMLDQNFGPMEPIAPVSAPPAPPAPDAKPFWQVPPLAAPAMPYIYAAMHAAMSEIRAVGKEGYNEQQRYNFRGIDGVVDAAGPAFRKHGIIPTPKLLEYNLRDTMTTGSKPTRECTVKVIYRFTALDGSYIEAEVPGESLDQSDKGSAKAMSVAYRIALLQVLAIPTQEKDPDASYLTRDGQTEIAPGVAKYLLAKVANGPLEDLPELWAIVTEHAAAERTAYTDDTRSYTWHEVFGGRWAAAVDGIETFEQGKAVYEAGKATKMLEWRVGNAMISNLLRARSAFLQERMTAALDAVQGALDAAGNTDQLDAAEAMLIEYAAKKHIQGPNAAQMATRIADKRSALEAAAAAAGEGVTP